MKRSVGEIHEWFQPMQPMCCPTAFSEWKFADHWIRITGTPTQDNSCHKFDDLRLDSDSEGNNLKLDSDSGRI